MCDWSNSSIMPVLCRQGTLERVSEKSIWTGKTQAILPYAMIGCFIIVIGAILLYCKHLQKMRVVPSLTNVPSMSYFMTSADQVEQGLVEEKHYYTWDTASLAYVREAMPMLEKWHNRRVLGGRLTKALSWRLIVPSLCHPCSFNMAPSLSHRCL